MQMDVRTWDRNNGDSVYKAAVVYVLSQSGYQVSSVDVSSDTLVRRLSDIDIIEANTPNQSRMLQEQKSPEGAIIVTTQFTAPSASVTQILQALQASAISNAIKSNNGGAWSSIKLQQIVLPGTPTLEPSAAPSAAPAASDALGNGGTKGPSSALSTTTLAAIIVVIVVIIAVAAFFVMRQSQSKAPIQTIDPYANYTGSVPNTFSSVSPVHFSRSPSSNPNGIQSRDIEMKKDTNLYGVNSDDFDSRSYTSENPGFGHIRRSSGRLSLTAALPPGIIAPPQGAPISVVPRSTAHELFSSASSGARRGNSPHQRPSIGSSKYHL